MNGPEIRAARERLGLSMPALATLFGMTMPWLSRIETGVRDVPWYVPLVIGLLERDPEAIPGLLEAGVENKIGAPAYFVTMMRLAARSKRNGAIVTQWIAGEMFAEPVDA
jgi:hypothetical protein